MEPRSAIIGKGSDITAVEETEPFDDDTLRAIAEVYKNEGNNEYKKKNFDSAIYFYTEGIKVNCKDEEMKAKLYSNRATVHLKLGNYTETLNDAKIATDLQPCFLKAIARGASAYLQLNEFDAAITWCDKGLAVEPNNQKLLELQRKSVKEQTKLTRHGKKKTDTRATHFKTVIDDHKRKLETAKKLGDRLGEGRAFDDEPFDDDTLRAIAEVYKIEGNNEYKKKNFDSAIYFYTEGIEVNCKDEELKARLYSNRATAHLKLGNYMETLNDAKIATDLQPCFLNAIARGASAYLQLNEFDAAITWCDKGLAVEPNNQKLLELRRKSVKEQIKLACRHGEKKTDTRTTHCKSVIDDYEPKLETAKKLGDESGEGRPYGFLGDAYYILGDFKKAIEYFTHDLKISEELGDRSSEGAAYGNLGNVYNSQGDFKRAIGYHERCLKIAKELGDKSREGVAYGNLGSSYGSLGDLKTAEVYHKRDLKIAKELSDRRGEGRAYGNLGNVHILLGDYKTAREYCERHLEFTKELGDTLGEGQAYSNLGNAYFSLGDLKTALDYYERSLKIAKEFGHRSAEQIAFCNLGITYGNLGHFNKAIDHLERGVKIATELGDRSREGKSYGWLGVVQQLLGDYKTAIEYYERHLRISKELGDTLDEGMAYSNLGHCFEILGDFPAAIRYYKLGITLFNDIRGRLQLNDEWKIFFRDQFQNVYSSLWRLLFEEGKFTEALVAAEQGRAQGLKDLIALKYGFQLNEPESGKVNTTFYELSNCIPPNTIFMAIGENELLFWVFQKEKEFELRRKKIDSQDEINVFFRCVLKKGRASDYVQCEDRSLELMNDERLAVNRSAQYGSQTQHLHLQERELSTLHDTIIDPIQDLFVGSELIFVPEGPLCFAPFAAFKGPDSKYLCESFRIRVAPSLTSLKMIADCPLTQHHQTGALLIGDPLTDLSPLPCAREEVELIGRMIGSTPLTGIHATKDAVLSQICSVALVHIAAHGNMETGEIALAPKECVGKDILTMADVLHVQMRPRLVVLSCCHSAHGEIKAEGVVGIARAFLGAGARSVLVSLWAIDDKATLEFMKKFYQYLVEGKSASEALNKAMNCMRESKEFSAVNYWAPFVLIGDDVTLEFDGRK